MRVRSDVVALNEGRVGYEPRNMPLESTMSNSRSETDHQNRK